MLPNCILLPYRILIVGVSGSGKTNALLNLISNEPDPYKGKYKLLINKRESIGLKNLNDY